MTALYGSDFPWNGLQWRTQSTDARPLKPWVRLFSILRNVPLLALTVHQMFLQYLVWVPNCIRSSKYCPVSDELRLKWQETVKSNCLIWCLCCFFTLMFTVSNISTTCPLLLRTICPTADPASTTWLIELLFRVFIRGSYWILFSQVIMNILERKSDQNISHLGNKLRIFVDENC